MIIKTYLSLCAFLLIGTSSVCLQNPKESIIETISQLENSRSETLFNIIAQEPAYKQYRQRKALLDIGALIGMGSALNQVFNQCAPMLEKTLFNNQENIMYGPEILSYASNNPWLYSACAAGATMGFTAAYMYNYQGKGNNSIDTKMRCLITPFEDARLRTITSHIEYLNLLHDMIVVTKENEAITDKCIALQRSALLRFLSNLETIVAKDDESDNSWAQRIENVRKRLTIYINDKASLEEGKSSYLHEAQDILTASLIASALSGSGNEVRSGIMFSDESYLCKLFKLPLISYLYCLGHMLYHKASAWNLTYTYNQLTSFLQQQSDKKNAEYRENASDIIMNIIAYEQQINRTQGFAIEMLIGNELPKKIYALERVQADAQKKSNYYNEILTLLEAIAASLNPE